MEADSSIELAEQKKVAAMPHAHGGTEYSPERLNLFYSNTFDQFFEMFEDFSPAVSVLLLRSLSSSTELRKHHALNRYSASVFAGAWHDDCAP